MIDFERTLYEIWWVSHTDDEDSESVYEDFWSLEIAREKLYSLQQSAIESVGHYCIVKAVSRYEEI